MTDLDRGGINFIIVAAVPGGDDRWYGQIIGNAYTREDAEEILGRVDRNPRYRYSIGEVSYG